MSEKGKINISQIRGLDQLPHYLNKLGELNIEDNNIVLNYNSTGDTSNKGIGGGLTIQDGDALGNDVTFRIGSLNTLTDTDLNITEYTNGSGYTNLGFFTELNDIVLGNTSTGTTDGTRVIKEKDIINGGTISGETAFSGSNRYLKFLVNSSEQTGLIPSVSDLLPGELMLNIADGKLFTLKGSSGSYEVIELLSGSLSVNYSTISTTTHSNNEDGVITVDTGLSYVGGEYISITYPEDTTNVQIALVTDYTGDQLTFTHVSNNGNKLNFDNWIIDITSEPSNTNFSTISTTTHSNNEGGTLTVDTGLSYVGSEYISITYPEDTSNVQIATVTEYIGDQLTFSHVSNNGNKLNFDNWIIDITSAPPAPTIQNLVWTSPVGTSNVDYYPSYGFFDYSHSMFIIRASELGYGSKLLHGLEIEVKSYSNGYTYGNQTLKLAHISDLEFGDNVKVDLTNINGVANVTTVKNDFDWTISSSGYQTIDFDSNFEYNGNDSLLIIWENRDGDWDSGFGWAECHFDNTYYDSWYKHEDDAYPTGYGTKDQSYRPNFKLKY